jgi:GH15 family glucan-1,4-alpha-glucosidase
VDAILRVPSVPSRIEDYALLGNLHTAALVGRDGSVDWLCLPRFDSGACFAALLGEPEHGRWKIAPPADATVERRYRGETLVLETDFHTADGVATVVDCMPVREGAGALPELVRIVVGRSGHVAMRAELVMRLDYGSLVPWVRREGDAITAIAGPDELRLATTAPLRGENFRTVSSFTVSEGERVAFVLGWCPSHEKPPSYADPERAVLDTAAWWERWSSKCSYDGEYASIVRRSLITLKALTYAPTGGIVAAATTSLPERIGGVRNWDYRMCWLRDATFTLYALLNAGYRDEALAWRSWLLRAIAGKPSQIQIMYGLAGERRLTELELEWLPGYLGSRPVRVGNAAHRQLQLDVYGEVLDVLHLCRRVGLTDDKDTWRLERALAGHLEGIWREPDDGIWEVRGQRMQFTHSKVMAWLAMDRAIKGVEEFGFSGPVERWRRVRSEIHADVCENAWNADMGSFVQAYGSRRLDASLLMLPLVGFLPATDPRIQGTVRAIERELLHDGFVLRYSTEEGEDGVDGLPPGEGAFLACTFWLADNLMLLGRRDEARAMFERLVGLCNDVGLLSEQYDPIGRRLLGNVPQAFSHVSLVNTARNLHSRDGGPAEHRRRG